MTSSKFIVTPTKSPPSTGIEANLASALAKFNQVMRNQFVIDVMILVQAATFLIHPEQASQTLIRSFAATIFFAAIGILLGHVLTHSLSRHNLGPIITIAASLVTAAVLYFAADFFAPILHYAVAILVVWLGIVRIWGAYHFAEIRRLGKSLGLKITSVTNRNPDFAGISGAAKQNAKVEAIRILSPAILFSDKTAKFHYGQLILGPF